MKKHTTLGGINLGLKIVTGTVGSIGTGIRKGADVSVEKSEIIALLDKDGHIDLIKGEGESQEYAVGKVIDLFSNVKVHLTDEEIKQVESRAKELAEELGQDYEITLAGLKASALKAKQLAADSK